MNSILKYLSRQVAGVKRDSLASVKKSRATIPLSDIPVQKKEHTQH